MAPVAADGRRGESLPVPCLVVLVGPSGSGKSTWAAAHFADHEIVSSDRLRDVVGRAEDDLDASDDAFALLDEIVGHRVRRGLSTVVDTLGFDADRRRSWREVAAIHGVPCVAVAFDVEPGVCRARNRARVRPVPAAALTSQLRRWVEVRGALDAEGFARVLRPDPARPDPVGPDPVWPDPVRLVDAHLASSVGFDVEQRERPVGVRFGLHLSSFPWRDLEGGMRSAAAAAERAGFDSIWVMDHVRQIPQVGRDWDPMLESYTTLAWLAAATTRVRLGALVTAITFRNVGHLAKIVATLDVLSGGRAACGLGLGWYEREHRGYGWVLPSVADRYALLEDALGALRALWGPGAKAFDGRVLHLPDTTCYPRPLQARVPVVVGGGGERRTLRLAARHADAVNVMGPVDVVRRKVEVLARHCVDVGRDPTEVAVTHLAPTLVGEDRAEVDQLVERLRPRRLDAARYKAQVSAGTVDDQIARVRELADAGVSEVVVSLPDLGGPWDESGVAAVDRFAEVISAFRT